MAANLVEADQALEQLLVELKTLKSSSQQLQEAEKMTEQAVQSAEAVVKLTADVLETTNRQSQTITQLTQEMQAQTVQSAEVVVKLVAEVLEATNRQTQIVTQFTQEMQAQMAAARRAANVNRWLTVIVLLLAGVSAILAYLTYQTLIAL